MANKGAIGVSIKGSRGLYMNMFPRELCVCEDTQKTWPRNMAPNKVTMGRRGNANLSLLSVMLIPVEF